MIRNRSNFVVILIAFLISINTISAQKETKLTLLTCGAGTDLYAAFGHSAVRIISPSDTMDMIYNFGIFDFNDPDFYPKFLNGIMLYMLGTQYTDDFIMDYSEDNRWVVEQTINLPDSTQIALVEWLVFTRKPENRKYYYDFLRNNCSSKLRDIVMIMQYNNLKFSNPRLNKTHRDLLAECMRENKWAGFGINVLLSSLIDVKVTPFEEMFLPDYLSKHGEKVTIGSTPVLGKPVHINQVPITYPTWHFSFTDPVMIMIYLLIITLLYRKNWLRNTFFILVALVGVFLIYMWFGTQQTYVKYNYNILWLNPLYLLLIPMMAFKKQFASFGLLIAILLCQVIVLFAWLFKIQGFDIAFFPMIVMLMVYNVRALILMKPRTMFFREAQEELV